MANIPEEQQNAKGTLVTLRIIWGAMVAGVVVFGVVVVVICSRGGLQNGQTSQNVVPVLTAIAFGMVVVLVPIGYFIRNQVYKRNWEGNAITPAGYHMGNVILLAMCDAAAFVSLVFTMVVGSLGLVTAPGLIALGVMLVNFPTGRPMEGTGNPYQAPPPR